MLSSPVFSAERQFHAELNVSHLFILPSHKQPMGWMSWERFRCITDCKTYPKECISENLIVEMADIMAKEGFVYNKLCLLIQQFHLSTVIRD